jgi:DNA polymerase-3 subunit epsilon
MRAVCIDFETANGFIGSACSVGIAVLEEGQIVDTNYWLIKPHPQYSYFDPLNVQSMELKRKMSRTLQNSISFMGR